AFVAGWCGRVILDERSAGCDAAETLLGLANGFEGDHESTSNDLTSEEEVSCRLPERASEDGVVEAEVILSHTSGREVPLDVGAAVFRADAVEIANGVGEGLGIFDDETSSAVEDNLGQSTAGESNHGRSAGHGFHGDEGAGFLDLTGNEERGGVGEQIEFDGEGG